MISRRLIAISFFLSLFGIFLIGCGAKIPREVTSKVSFKEDFKTLQESPDRYVGEFVILGGKIITIENQAEYSEIAVLQFPLDSNHRPQPDKISNGRFLVRSETFLDPAIYQPGEYVTVAGEITGSEIRTVDAYDYRYPIIKAERIWIWEPDKGGWMPNLRFGIGVGAVF